MLAINFVCGISEYYRIFWKCRDQTHFQYFKKSQVKAIVTSTLLIVVISYTAFNSSPMFQTRVINAFDNVLNYEEERNTSVGQRITFLTNSWKMFLNAPVIGVGTGDFPGEYKKISVVNSPGVRTTNQPHNMYMLVLSQLGLVGLGSFLLIFYFQFKLALALPILYIKNIGVAMPLLFLIIMWSDSYLLGHFTGNLFILFSSFVYSSNLVTSNNMSRTVHISIAYFKLIIE